MATIKISRLDDSLVDQLKRRGALNHRSIEGEARYILEQAVADDLRVKRSTFLETSDQLRNMTRGSRQTPSEELIREDRDRDHR